MNDNEHILAEIRKISAWVDMQRKISKWSIIFVAIFIPALIVFGIVMEQHTEKKMKQIRRPEESWSDVYRTSSVGDLEKAIRIGESLIQKSPGYEYGHTRLAFVYLTAGDLQQALHHFEEAYRLFPSCQNAENLQAIRKRIEKEPPTNPLMTTD